MLWLLVPGRTVDYGVRSDQTKDVFVVTSVHCEICAGLRLGGEILLVVTPVVGCWRSQKLGVGHAFI